MAAKVLSREALLGAAPQTTTVELKDGPLAGSSVVIRSLSRGARKAWAEAISSGDPDATEVLLVESLVEPALERKDVKALGAIDEKVIDELVGAIAMFNGWVGNKDQDKLDLLKKVAEGGVQPEAALPTFR
jgi:hypothetical protein